MLQERVEQGVPLQSDDLRVRVMGLTPAAQNKSSQRWWLTCKDPDPYVGRGQRMGGMQEGLARKVDMTTNWTGNLGMAGSTTTVRKMIRIRPL